MVGRKRDAVETVRRLAVSAHLRKRRRRLGSGPADVHLAGRPAAVVQADRVWVIGGLLDGNALSVVESLGAPNDVFRVGFETVAAR